VMLTALRTAVWRDGFKIGEGGYEVLLLVSALALAESGPGPWSLDALLKSERSGVSWAAAALAAAATGSTLAIALGKRQPAPTEDREAAEERGEPVVRAASSDRR
jgi:putative oxidoreductase